MLPFVVASTSPGVAAQPSFPSPIVETIAGPGYCDGTTLFAAPPRVGSLSVDDAGRIFVDLVDSAKIRVVNGSRSQALPSFAPTALERDPTENDQIIPGSGRLAADGLGGVFVATGETVVQLSTEPLASTSVAGDPGAPAAEMGTLGDGGPAGEARFTNAISLAADGSAGLFVADVDKRTTSIRIRFVNQGPNERTFSAGTPNEIKVAPGHIDTIAGGSQGRPSDGSNPRLESIQGSSPSLAVSGDLLYLAFARPRTAGPAVESTVAMVNLGSEVIDIHGMRVLPGSITSVAGEGTGEPGGNGATGQSERLPVLSGIAADDDDLYLADLEGGRVLRVDAAGAVSIFAGGGSLAGLRGNEQPARAARLDQPTGVAVGPGDRVFISEKGSGVVRFVDRVGLLHAGPGFELPTRCEATEARAPTEGHPYSVDGAPGGSIAFTNLSPGRPMGIDLVGSIRPIDVQTTPSLTTAALLSTAGEKGLYLYDVFEGRVVFANVGSGSAQVHGVTIAPGTSTTVAGTGRVGGGADAGRATDIPLGGPERTPGDSPGAPVEPPTTLVGRQRALGGLAHDADGNLFIADAGSSRIRQVDASGMMTSVAGVGGPSSTGACCATPAGLALDAFANLYVSDSSNDTVWYVNRTAQPVTVHGRSVQAGGAERVAGAGLGSDLGGEGVAAVDVGLATPLGLAVDGQGALYIAEYDAHSIRRVDPNGRITTVVGSGQPGFNGDGQAPLATSLSFPTDVGFDRCGGLLIADGGNDRVRRMGGAGGCPPLAASVPLSDPSGLARWMVGGGLVGLGLILVVVRRRFSSDRDDGPREFSDNTA